MLSFGKDCKFDADSNRISPEVLVRILAIALSAVCLLGTAGTAQEAATATTIVHGTVINSVTQEPIGRAQVYSPDNRFATMTDDQGQFKLALPADNDPRANTNLAVVLTARKPGFLSNQGRDNVQVSENEEVKIELTPEAIIMGRVGLSSGDTADGIPVQLFRREVRDGIAHWLPGGAFTTNSSGEYRFAELTGGSYRIGTREMQDRDPEDFKPRGKVYGYPPVYFPGAATFFGTSTIRLNSGQTFQADFSLARRQYFPIKIALTNAPATGFNINVSLQGDGAPGYSLGQGPQQTIAGSLPDGNYVVEVSTYGPEVANGQLHFTVANAPVEEAKIMLLRSSPIPVSVTEEFTGIDPSGQGNFSSGGDGDRFQTGRRRYLNLSVFPISEFGQGDYASLQPPTGPHDESMVLTPVRPGKYWVQVMSQRGYAASVISGGTDLLHHPLIVGSGGATPPIAITMRDDFAFLEGSVEGVGGESSGSVSGKPPAYVYCIPEPESAGQFTQAFISSEGKLNATQLPPGTYRVLAFLHAQENLEYRNPEVMRSYESRGTLVRLGPGQRETVQLQIITKAGEDAE